VRDQRPVRGRACGWNIAFCYRPSRASYGLHRHTS
jgi:hypothetical protein